METKELVHAINSELSMVNREYLELKHTDQSKFTMDDIAKHAAKLRELVIRTNYLNERLKQVAKELKEQ